MSGYIMSAAAIRGTLLRMMGVAGCEGTQPGNLLQVPLTGKHIGMPH